MCGIAGWLSAGRAKPTKKVLRAMTDAIAHRGPDGSGHVVVGPVGLGHRRLSIIDLAGGAQPMCSPDDRIALTFNGEIYNYAELRRDLERLGYRFRTNSDTEVILHGYAAWGAGVVEKLNGMFAFAAYDAQTGTVLLARDRMGQKPLYYAPLEDGSLVFASELKAVLKHPKVAPKIDPTAVALYLTYEYVPYPYTAFAGIRKLPPGEVLEWRKDGWTTRPYYVIPFGEQPAFHEAEDWIAETRAALSRSTRRRLMSDVPLGVFLSGGIDSSAIVAMMSEHVDGPSIRTFSIAFEESSFDESSYAERVARRFHTQHQVETLSADRMVELLPDALAYMDEPFGDASYLPTYLLSAFTRQHVTVALGGDGGDELFLGYETFRADSAAQLYRLAPPPLRDGFARAVQALPVNTRNFSLDFVLKSFVRGADAVPEFRHTRWLSSFLPNAANDPLKRELRDAVPDGTVYGVMARPYLACADPDHRQRLSHMYLRTYMAEDILTKVDRASMASSLEVRSPFMDPEVVALAATMPASLKLRHGYVAKYALKKALERDLPHDILYRKKKGFGIPVARWLNGALAGEVDRLLAPDRIREGGLLEPGVVSRLVQEHRDGARDNRKQLWTLMMLESWRERFDARL